MVDFSTQSPKELSTKLLHDFSFLCSPKTPTTALSPPSPPRTAVSRFLSFLQTQAASSSLPAIISHRRPHLIPKHKALIPFTSPLIPLVVRRTSFSLDCVVVVDESAVDRLLIMWWLSDDWRVYGGDRVMGRAIGVCKGCFRLDKWLWELALMDWCGAVAVWCLWVDGLMVVTDGEPEAVTTSAVGSVL
ncbi:hypothetical protein Droror1_Dr00024582, partial [Drosera rotundifolia]